MTDQADPSPRPRDLQVLTTWDAQALQTSDITPSGASAAVLLWGDDLDPDGGPADHLARRLVQAMTSLGEVCFRHGEAAPKSARSLGTVKASRLPWRRGWAVIGSRDPDVVLTLFDGAWSQGDQTAIVGAPNDDRVRQVLGTDRLTDLRLNDGEWLFSAIVDGAGMLICAPSAVRLTEVLTAFRGASGEGYDTSFS